VRTRLVLITLLPLAGLAILTGLQARTSLSVVADAGRAHTLADSSTSTMELLHQLGQEQAEVLALRDRGGTSGQFLVTAQRTRTDEALDAFRRTSSAAIVAAPGLRATLEKAAHELAELATIRSAASPGLDTKSPAPPTVTT